MIYSNKEKYFLYIFKTYQTLMQYRLAFYCYVNLTLFILLDFEIINIAALNLVLVAFEISELMRFFKFRTALSFTQNEVMTYLICLSSANGF